MLRRSRPRRQMTWRSVTRYSTSLHQTSGSRQLPTARMADQAERAIIPPTGLPRARRATTAKASDTTETTTLVMATARYTFGTRCTWGAPGPEDGLAEERIRRHARSLSVRSAEGPVQGRRSANVTMRMWVVRACPVAQRTMFAEGELGRLET